MNANPINLAVRFLLELAMLFVLSWWGWRFHGIVTAIGLPVAAAVMWGVFRIPNDPKAAPVAVPGVVRLALEWGLFGFAVMSCGTLRELFSIAMRYFALTMMQIQLTLFETTDDCLIELDAGHLPADVQGFFIERDIAGIIATTMGFALPVAEKYAEEVSAELAVDEQLLRPLLELVPVHDVAFGRALPGFGEDNEYVLTQLLNFSRADVARLAAEDVI